MSRAPLISVLLPVFNEARFVRSAIESILGQTFGDFELIVVDDGSTDGSLETVLGIRDRRLRVLSNGANWGITTALNHGLDAARGRYVARMDADDIALPERFARQVALLEAHADVGIVGTARTLIELDDRVVGESRPPCDDLSIRWKCLLGSPFGHPTVMIRRSLLAGHSLWYRDAARAEDYDLWPRLLAHTRGANLEEPLLRYRLRERNVQSQAEQLASHDRVALSAIRALVPSFSTSLAEVTQLRGRFGGFSVREASMDPKEPRWTVRYGELLEAFIAMYREAPGMDTFRAGQLQAA